MHPYTRGLLESMPPREREGAANPSASGAIEGMVPDLCASCRRAAASPTAARWSSTRARATSPIWLPVPAPTREAA
jgi:ABC-type dipeptide/oligopeptide/nickel transport system ATPase component